MTGFDHKKRVSKPNILGQGMESRGQQDPKQFS